MRFIHLTLLASVLSPLTIHASHIPVRRQGPPAPPLPGAPSPPFPQVSPPAPPSAPAAAPGAPVPGAPTPPNPLSSAAGALPGPVGGLAKSLPKAPVPFLRRRVAHIDRRQFHNADFASSGSLPSSNIESDGADDSETD